MKDGFLIPLDKHDSIFVTKELIDLEKNIMDLVDRGKNTGISVIPKDKTIDNIAIAASEETKKTAICVLQSKDRVSLIESGKRDNKDLIAAILELAEDSKKTVRVLSPSRLIANDINTSISRRKPDNLWQWFLSLGKPEIGESVAGFKHKYKEEIDLPDFLLRFKQEKDVIIVNDTERVDPYDTKALLELTEKSKAKLILIRDTTAKQGLSAGNPIETLKQAHIESFKTGFAKNGSFNHSDPLEPGSSETQKIKKPDIFPELKAIKDNNRRIRALAKEYAQKENQERENTVILVGSQNQLKATNEAIREELKNQNKIFGLEHNISILNPVYMSKEESALAHKYQKNMMIRFYKRHQLPDDWNVEDYNRKINTLRLIQNKERFLWNPKTSENQEINYAVFKKENLQIAKGDKLIATSNMRGLGIKNGTKFAVSNVCEKYVELVPAITNGSTTKTTKNTKNIKATKIKLDDFKNSHFQYDYATTFSRSLKKQSNNIIADLKAYTLDKL